MKGEAGRSRHIPLEGQSFYAVHRVRSFYSSEEARLVRIRSKPGGAGF